MNIVVLAGGTSTERAVSIVSGTGICKALRSLGHRSVLVDVFFGCTDEQASQGFSEEYDTDRAVELIHANDARLEKELGRREFFGPHVLELCQAADLVFMALHGSNGEDGRVQAAFDLFGIRYSGTDYISSAIAMDKTRTKQIFNACGIPTPRGKTVWRGKTSAEQLLQELRLPLIVKPQCGGSSIGVTICRTTQELKKGLKTSFSYEEAAIVEEFIEGRELTAAVLDDVAYPIVEIIPREGFYDYRNKYQAGATIETCPAEIPEHKTREVHDIAVQAAKALGIEAYVRFDFLMRASDDKIFCLEANTLPGMTPTSLVPLEARTAGLDYPALCQKMIDISLKKYENGWL